MNKKKLFLFLVICFLSIKIAGQEVLVIPRALAADTAYPQGSILKTWALKNLLTVTPEQDHYRSPLLGIIAIENGTIKKWYGEFTDTTDLVTGRFKRTFTTEPPLPLEEITRLFFDQMDGKIRCVASGSNPVIGLTAQQVGQWVQLIKEKGIKGFTKVFGKKEGKPAKKGSPKTAEQQQQKEFLDPWFATYKLRPEGGKFSDDPGRLRRWVETLSGHLEALAIVQGEETAIKQFLTILMSYVYLKDLQEAVKRPEYSIANYFKALGVEYQASFYKKTDKEIIEKRIVDGSLGDSPEAFENMVFYMIALIRSSYNFLEQPFVSIYKNEKIIPLCAETSARSMFNLVLYNFSEEKFDFSVLPIEIQKMVNENFKIFFTAHANPLVSDYYVKTIMEWKDLIDLCGLSRGNRGTDLLGTYEVILELFNYVFGTKALTFEELGKKLSIDTHYVIFGPYDQKTEQFFMKVIDTKTDSLVQAFITTKSYSGHTDFFLESDSIFHLLEEKAFEAVLRLQEKYQMSLVPIVFTPLTVNLRNSKNIAPVEYASIKALKALLENGASVNPDLETVSQTPLSRAILEKDKEKVSLLLRYGAKNIHYNNHSLLSLAARMGLIAIVRLMQEYGFEDSSLDVEALLSLHDAIKKNDRDRALNLIESSMIDVNESVNGQTPLSLAVSLNNEEMVKLLIHDGAETLINVQDDLGDTMLHQAVRVGNDSIIKLLIAYGASPLIANGQGKSVYDLVHEAEFLRFLPSIETQKKISLVEAIKGEYNDKVEEILADSGVCIDEVDAQGDTALHAAFIKKDLKLAKRLLNYASGNSLAIQNDNGETPLLLSIKNISDDQLMEILIDFIARGADVNLADNQGNTPLLIASSGREPLVRFLLDHGALPSINVPNKYGKTPLENSFNRHITVPAILIAQGANPFMLSSNRKESIFDYIYNKKRIFPETYNAFNEAVEKAKKDGILKK